MKKVVILLAFLVSTSSGEKARINPSFNCLHVHTSLEKQICKSRTTAEYDTILDYIYKTLLHILSEGEKESLKQSQKNWLKTEREESYKQDQSIIKEKTFSNQEDPDAWVRRLDISYAKRINDLLHQYKDELENILFKEIGRYDTEESIPFALKFSFFWNLFRNYEGFDPDSMYSSNAFDISKESRLCKLKSGKWLIAHRGNTLMQLTNRDGGAYRFFLLNPHKADLKPLMIQEKGDEMKSREKFIQAYFIKFVKNGVMLGRGRMTFELSDDETTLLFMKNKSDTPKKRIKKN